MTIPYRVHDSEIDKVNAVTGKRFCVLKFSFQILLQTEILILDLLRQTKQ